MLRGTLALVGIAVQFVLGDLVQRLRDEYGIGLSLYPPNLLRAVTHYWIGPREVGTFLESIRDMLQ